MPFLYKCKKILILKNKKGIFSFHEHLRQCKKKNNIMQITNFLPLYHPKTNTKQCRFTKEKTSNNNSYIITSSFYNFPFPQITFTGKGNENDKSTISKSSRIEGCIIGGAIGDALGVPVEFCDLKTIKKYYGEEGVKELEIGMSGEADFSDDTQLTIFTADGILKAIDEKFDPQKAPQIEDMYRSFLDWYITQTETFSSDNAKRGWLAGSIGLYQRKAPGDTCLSALKSGKIGTVQNPINRSKGSGGVMRVAPIGLLYHKNPNLAFNIAMDNAAITHGHPSGYLSAGFFAALIANILNGNDIEKSVDKSLVILNTYKDNQEVKNKILLAKKLAKTDIPPTEAIKQLGQGWTGEEAIGIAVYCALKSPESYTNAVRMSVNHSGDSDTTGAITGNIMGAILGKESIPQSWLEKIQDKSLLNTVAKDLANVPKSPLKFKDKYPYNCGHTPNWYEKRPAIRPKPRDLRYTIFSANDVEKMRKMSTEEIIDYKRKLLNKRQSR